MVKSLSPAGMATIRALANRPGAVVSWVDLLSALPGTGTDAHAVETAERLPEGPAANESIRPFTATLLRMVALRQLHIQEAWRSGNW